MTDNTKICAYTAEKSNPEQWHGEVPQDWTLEDDLWSCPHTVLNHEEVDEPEYCVFHMDPNDVPDDVDEASRFVQLVNGQAETGTERQKTEFIGATFGEFQIEEGTTLKSEANSHLRLDHSTFQKGITVDKIKIEHETVSFCNVEFTSDRDASSDNQNNPLVGTHSFRDTEFGGTEEIQFNSATFEGDVRFSGTKFSEETHVKFDDATFTEEGEVWFNSANFLGRVSFLRTTFAGKVLFYRTKFFNNVWFAETVFDGEGEVSFDRAKFGGEETISFYRSEFRNTGDLSFNRTQFSGAKTGFIQTEFANGGKVSFEEAEFSGEVNFEADCIPHQISFANAELTNCDLTSNLMKDADLQRTDFTGSKLQNIDFSGANLEQSLLSRTNLYGANFTGSKIDGAVFGDAQVSQDTEFGSQDGKRVVYDPAYSSRDSSKSRSGREKLVRAIKRYLPLRPQWNKEHDSLACNQFRPREDSSSTNQTNDDSRETPEERLTKAARSYHSIEKIGRSNALPELQTRGFVRRQEMNRLRYIEKARTSKSWAWQHWSRWLRASVARLTLLYGESPWRVLSASLAVILFSGMIYPLGGFRSGSSTTPELMKATSFGEWLTMLPDGIYFSTLTFTTLGFGDFQPAGWGRILATGETAIGATLLALLVFVLGRRAAR